MWYEYIAHTDMGVAWRHCTVKISGGLMDKKGIKKLVAGLCLTGLIAGSSLGAYQGVVHASSG